MLLISIVGGLGAALGWAVGDLAAKHMVTKQGPYALLFPIQVIITLTTSTIYFILADSIVWEWKAIGIALIGSLFMNGAWFSYMRAFSVLPASIVSSFAALYALVPLIWSLINGLSLSLLQWSGSILALVGAILISIDLSELKKKSKPILISGISVAFSFPFLFGVGIQIMDHVTALVGSLTGYWYQTMAAFCVVPFLLLVLGKLRETRFPKHKLPILLNAGGSVLAFFSLYWGFNNGETAIVSIVSTLTPMFVAIYSFIFLRERLFSSQYIGIVVALFGLVLLGIP